MILGLQQLNTWKHSESIRTCLCCQKMIPDNFCDLTRENTKYICLVCFHLSCCSSLMSISRLGEILYNISRILKDFPIAKLEDSLARLLIWSFYALASYLGNSSNDVPQLLKDFGFATCNKLFFLTQSVCSHPNSLLGELIPDLSLYLYDVRTSSRLAFVVCFQAKLSH